MSQKIEWVDSLKGVGILAVILGHMNSPFSSFIFSWHMPLFFMIGGFFIDPSRPALLQIKKDFFRLFIPYLIFLGLAITAEIIKRSFLRRPELDFFSQIIGALIYMDMPRLSQHYGFVLWFLPALFFGKQIVFLVKKYISNIGFQFFIFILIYILSFKLDLLFALDEGMNSTLWIFLGSLYFQFKDRIRTKWCIPLTITFLYFINMPSLDMASKYYSNPMINFLWASSVFIFITEVLKFFQKNIKFIIKLSGFLGKGSLILFALHPYTNNVVHIFLNKIGYDFWALKFLISVFLLSPVLFIKLKYDGKGIFQYV